MAQLRRSIDDQHFYIKVGPSQGTKQITDEGITWLKTNEPGYAFPPPGGGVKLDLGNYRRLEKLGYLYIKGEQDTQSSTQSLLLPLLSPEAAKHGPPLLLLLANSQHSSSDDVDWTLVLQLDQWEESARDALLQHSATAVGCYVFPEAEPFYFSRISLQRIHDADCWPDVAPQKHDYTLYWQNRELYQSNSQSATLLYGATPTAGLKTGWQGNVFFRWNGNGLQNAWKRYLPGMSISERDVKEFYWLAQSNQRPDPPWPGKARCIGQANREWQLWHLQAGHVAEVEDIAEWLWYREIYLNYPDWRLHVLNPLSIVSDYDYTCMPAQPLLVRCDPPTQHRENGQSSAWLSLSVYATGAIGTTPLRLGGSPAQSPHLVSDRERYLHAPAPPEHQEYRISVRGEASGQSLHVRSRPLTFKQPGWLRGLSCMLLIGETPHPMLAFSAGPISEPALYQFSVDQDFSLAQLECARWHYQPAGLPCVLHWEYLSSEGKRCWEKRGAILTDAALTGWWQTAIWPAVAASPWVMLTLDAASFGSITLKLVLQREAVPRQVVLNTVLLPQVQGVEKSAWASVAQAWWTNNYYSANFFWLSHMLQHESRQIQQVVPPHLSTQLELLCLPGMPETLKSVLLLLATSRRMPAWIYRRVQALLAELHASSELIVAERR